MAETNPDGSRASFGERAYNFASNGGGTITYRMALLAAMTILIGLVSWIGSTFSDKLDKIDSRVQHVENNLPAYDTRISDNALQIQQLRDSQTKLWDTVSDHEHRITVLEAREPSPRR